MIALSTLSTRRVLTIGTFDLFHVGHLRFLKRAAEFGELTVGVNSDRFVEQYKGRKPAIVEWHRVEIVDAIKCVSSVVLNDGPGFSLIYDLSPDFLVVGSDWHRLDYLAQIDMPQGDLDGQNIGIVYLPRTPGVSTTALRA